LRLPIHTPYKNGEGGVKVGLEPIKESDWLEIDDLFNSEIELKKDGSVLEGRELKTSLQTNNQWPNIIIHLQVDFSQKEIKGLKNFYEDFFNKPTVSSDARSLAIETNKAFNDLATDLRKLSNESYNFPFITTFNQTITEIENKKDKISIE